MKIAIVGCGAIGSTFAYYLAKAGHDVTAIARPDSQRFAQLARDGGVVTRAGDRAAVTVADRLDEATPFDLIVVTVLAHQARALLPSLQRSKAARVHFMFNVFEPEKLLAASGERASFGMPFVTATLDADGRLHATVNAGRKTLHGDRACVATFDAAGIPSAYEPDMLLWLRCHVPLCVAMESIAVRAQRRGGGASWQESLAVARAMRGAFAIVRGLGYRLYPSGKARLAALPAPMTAAMLWALSRVAAFRDVLATGALECATLIDTVVAAAQATDAVPTDAVRALLAIKPV